MISTTTIPYGFSSGSLGPRQSSGMRGLIGTPYFDVFGSSSPFSFILPKLLDLPQSPYTAFEEPFGISFPDDSLDIPPYQESGYGYPPLGGIYPEPYGMPPAYPPYGMIPPPYGMPYRMLASHLPYAGTGYQGNIRDLPLNSEAQKQIAQSLIMSEANGKPIEDGLHVVFHRKFDLEDSEKVKKFNDNRTSEAFSNSEAMLVEVRNGQVVEVKGTFRANTLPGNLTQNTVGVDADGDGDKDAAVLLNGSYKYHLSTMSDGRLALRPSGEIKARRLKENGELVGEIENNPTLLTHSGGIKNGTVIESSHGCLTIHPDDFNKFWDLLGDSGNENLNLTVSSKKLESSLTGLGGMPSPAYGAQAGYPMMHTPYGYPPSGYMSPWGFYPPPWAIYPPSHVQNTFPMPSELPSDKAMSLAEYVTANISGKNRGACLSGVAEAITESYLGFGNMGSNDRHRDGGFYSYFKGLDVNGRIDYAKNAGPALQAMGLSKVGEYGFLEEMKEAGQNLLPGDVLVFEPDSGHPAGHIAIVGSDGKLYADGVEGQAGQAIANLDQVEERYFDFAVYRDKGPTSDTSKAQIMLEGGGFIDRTSTPNPWTGWQYPNQASSYGGSAYRLDQAKKERYIDLLNERAGTSINDFDSVARNIYESNGGQQGLGVTYEEFQEALLHIAFVESSFNPKAGNTASDGQRVQGLFQFKPSTARELGITGDLSKPEVSIEAGAQYLAKNLKKHNGDLEKALVSHNTGTNGVNGSDWQAKLSHEAQNYLKKFREAFKKEDTENSTLADYPTPTPQHPAQPAYPMGFPPAYPPVYFGYQPPPFPYHLLMSGYYPV